MTKEKKITDLSSITNALHRIFEKIEEKSEWLKISKLSVVISVMAVLIALLALNAANQANIRSQLLLDNLREVKEEVETYEVYYGMVKAELAARGIILPEKEE